MGMDVDCDADIILGYDRLRAHDPAFLHDSAAAVPALAAAARAVWIEDTLAGLPDTGTRLTDGTALLVGPIAFALPFEKSDTPDPEFAAPAGGPAAGTPRHT